MMHQKYLPFTKDELLERFIGQNEEHLKYYEESIKRYNGFPDKNPNREGKPLEKMEWNCQIEKDERFWIVAATMTIYPETCVKTG